MGPVIADDAVIPVPGVELVPSRALRAPSVAEVFAKSVGDRVSQPARLASQQHLQGVVVLRKAMDPLRYGAIVLEGTKIVEIRTRDAQCGTLGNKVDVSVPVVEEILAVASDVRSFENDLLGEALGNGEIPAVRPRQAGIVSFQDSQAGLGQLRAARVNLVQGQVRDDGSERARRIRESCRLLRIVEVKDAVTAAEYRVLERRVSQTYSGSQGYSGPVRSGGRNTGIDGVVYHPGVFRQVGRIVAVTGTVKNCRGRPVSSVPGSNVGKPQPQLQGEIRLHFPTVLEKPLGDVVGFIIDEILGLLVVLRQMPQQQVGVIVSRSEAPPTGWNQHAIGKTAVGLFVDDVFVEEPGFQRMGPPYFGHVVAEADEVLGSEERGVKSAGED